MRQAGEWTIVHLRVLAGLSAPLPAGVAVHSDVAVAIRSVVSRAAMRLEVSQAAIRSVASQVVTEAAEAADKSQDKLPYEEDHLILFFCLSFPVPCFYSLVTQPV